MSIGYRSIGYLHQGRSTLGLGRVEHRLRYFLDIYIIPQTGISNFLGVINLYKCKYSQETETPSHTPQFQSPQFQAPEFQPPQLQPYQAVPPARPEPPVTLTSGNDPNFPSPPSNRDSHRLPNVTTNIAETSRLIITFI